MTSRAQRAESENKPQIDMFKRMRGGLETFLNLDVQEIRRIIHNVECQSSNMQHSDLIRYFTQKIENFLYRLLQEVDSYNDKVEREMAQWCESIVITPKYNFSKYESFGPKQELENKMSKLTSKVDETSDELMLLKANLARLESNVAEHIKSENKAPKSNVSGKQKDETSKSKKERPVSGQSSELSVMRVLYKIEHKIDELMSSKKSSMKEQARAQAKSSQFVS